jgi:signal transduction histidine kinase
MLARDPRPSALHREPIELANVAAACAREFKDRFQAKHITLETRLASCIIDGDERRLRQLVGNLLNNALRQAQERVVISTFDDHRYGRITVEDDGSDVPREERERVFQQFRGDDSDEAGLGLAVVAWIARAHEGTARVEPAQGGRGARIVTTLPALTR